MKTPSFQEFIDSNPSNNSQQLPPDIMPLTNNSALVMPQQNNQQQALMQQQQNAQMMRGPDPFAGQKYSNVMFPDMPLQYGNSLTESLLNDNEVPADVRKKYWFVFHKDNVLTFLDEERKKSKLLNFDIAKIDILNTMPYYDYTFDEELNFTVLRNVFETKLDRSLGFKGSAQKNERIVLQSQFQEQRQISENNDGGQIKEGFFKRLLGRR